MEINLAGQTEQEDYRDYREFHGRPSGIFISEDKAIGDAKEDNGSAKSSQIDSKLQFYPVHL